MSNTQEVLDAIKGGFSKARIAKYESAMGVTAPDDPRAVALYAWNAQVSAALFAPLHMCEVVVRNAVADALESVHGAHWPWETGFQASLPSSQIGYSPRQDLVKVASEQPTTGKVIPELKFVFWEQMFTKRHDLRLWNSHLKRVFPSAPATTPVRTLRRRIYHDLEVIRHLRNRIAHHEPIFSRNLKEELEKMVELVRFRSPLVASWMEANQKASGFISQLPIFRGGTLWSPSHQEIQIEANRIWVSGGRRDGTADDDWFSAERSLLAR